MKAAPVAARRSSGYAQSGLTDFACGRKVSSIPGPSSGCELQRSKRQGPWRGLLGDPLWPFPSLFQNALSDPCLCALNISAIRTASRFSVLVSF